MHDDAERILSDADDDTLQKAMQYISEWVTSPAPILIVVPIGQHDWKIFQIPSSYANTLQGTILGGGGDLRLVDLIDKLGSTYKGKAKALKEISAKLNWINDMRNNPSAQRIFTESLVKQIHTVRNNASEPKQRAE